MTSYSLMRVSRLSLDSFAARAGVHPELVRRFVALARIQRLRAGLSVNYAALGLVMDLLDRIEVLEAALRTTGSQLPHNSVRSPSPVARCEE